MGLIFFSSGNTHTKELLIMLYPGLEGVTELDTDPKCRFASFKATLSNGTKPGNSWLGGQFFEGLQNYMENKNEGNENKIYLETLIVP